MGWGFIVSYLVLARKWRPTHFDEVVGQSHVTQTLKNAIELNRVAHALLFTGSRGIGKTSCARILAKALNCENGPTVSPCGACSSCDQIISGTSVDVFEIDGASNNSVEQIREIRESVKFLPAGGRRKIYIIDEVHMLSTSAFNALLKTLEEPPEHVLFIFATTEPHKIPETIISRCQRYDFKRIPERIIVDALIKIADKEGLTVDEAALFHVAREAQGGMRDSLSLLDQVIAYCGLTIAEDQTRDILGIADRSVFSSLVDALIRGDSQQVLTLVDDQYRKGLDLQKFSAELVRHVRDLMVLRVVDDAHQLVDLPRDQLESLGQRVAQIEPGRLHRMLSTLLTGAEEVSRSSFPKLAFEMVLLRMCQQGSTLPLAEVLAGLERIEAGLAQSPLGQIVDAEDIDHSNSSVPTSPVEIIQDKTHVPKDETRPPWEPNVAHPNDVYTAVENAAPAQSPSDSQDSQLGAQPPSAPVPETTNQPAAAQSADSGSTHGESRTVKTEQESGHEQPESAADEVTQSVNLEQVKSASSDDNPQTSGLKSRPDTDGEYDDLSGGPPSPMPIESLRPLAVKPRTPLAIPESEVRPFLGQAAEPPSRKAEITTEKIAVSDDSPAVSDDTSAGTHSDLQAGPVELTMAMGNSPMDAFTDLLERVQAQDAFIGSELTQCLHLVDIGPSGLSVVTLDSHWSTIGASAEALLVGVAKTAFGDHFKVHIDVQGSECAKTQTETVFERKQRLAREHEAMRIEQAKRDPNIVLAQRVLEADIVDVKLASLPQQN